EARLLASTSPSWLGGAIASNLGVDNIRALTIPGDANFNGTVDTVDFNLLVTNFSQGGKGWGDGDFSFDTIVDTVDFNQLAANFSRSAPADTGGLLPEPAGLLAIAMMITLSLLRRQRYS